MSSEAKIIPEADLARSPAGGRRVIAAGAFDLPHVGHLRFLRAAREAGDSLTVLILSDDAIRKDSGADRPVMAAGQRARVLAGFECVDTVSIVEDVARAAAIAGGEGGFIAAVGEESSPAGDDLARAAEAADGTVLRIPQAAPGVSTSAIIERIRQNR